MEPSANPFLQALRVLGLYVRSQFIISSIETLLYAIGFAIAHVPWWPLFALIGGICSLIPSVGSLIPLALVGLAMLIAKELCRQFIRNWRSRRRQAIPEFGYEIIPRRHAGSSGDSSTYKCDNIALE